MGNEKRNVKRITIPRKTSLRYAVNMSKAGGRSSLRMSRLEHLRQTSSKQYSELSSHRYDLIIKALAKMRTSDYDAGFLPEDINTIDIVLIFSVFMV